MSGPRAPKGTYDLFPAEADGRDLIVAVAADVFASYGYRHIVTPEFEDTALFQRGVGDATDIVRKEMYTFSDRGERSLTLRPEGTAPICRAYVEHGMHKLPQPVKLWYYAPMFRYERPQAGRFRQHYQLGAEAIGSDRPAVDAEVIAMLATLYDELDIDDLTLARQQHGRCRLPAAVSSRSCVSFLDGRAGELCGECRERTALNPLRTFDCKVEACRGVLDEAPRLVDHLCPECEPTTSCSTCWSVSGSTRSPTSASSADSTTTRARPSSSAPAELGAQSGVGGGGRYDGLVELLGGPATPGVGFGTGLERIALVSRLDDDPPPGPLAYVVCFDEGRRDDAFVLTERLRSRPVRRRRVRPRRAQAKGQLRQATRSAPSWRSWSGCRCSPPRACACATLRPVPRPTCRCRARRLDRRLAGSTRSWPPELEDSGGNGNRWPTTE